MRKPMAHRSGWMVWWTVTIYMYWDWFDDISGIFPCPGSPIELLLCVDSVLSLLWRRNLDSTVLPLSECWRQNRGSKITVFMNLDLCETWLALKPLSQEINLNISTASCHRQICSGQCSQCLCSSPHLFFYFGRSYVYVIRFHQILFVSCVTSHLVCFCFKRPWRNISRTLHLRS